MLSQSEFDKIHVRSYYMKTLLFSQLVWDYLFLWFLDSTLGKNSLFCLETYMTKYYLYIFARIPCATRSTKSTKILKILRKRGWHQSLWAKKRRCIGNRFSFKFKEIKGGRFSLNSKEIIDDKFSWIRYKKIKMAITHYLSRESDLFLLIAIYQVINEVQCISGLVFYNVLFFWKKSIYWKG